MRIPLNSMQHTLAQIVAERPWTGWFGSGSVIATGFWTILEGATKVGGFFIVAIGLCAALLNYRVQKLAKEKVELELRLSKERLQESNSAMSQAPGQRDSS
jgi:membrane protein implicated in regulation of membrane protease activity